MKKNEKYQSLIRFLKEKNCYKTFYRNFIKQTSKKWRCMYGYGIDTNNFQKWYENISSKKPSKNWLCCCNNNFNAIILSKSFCWAWTNEPIDFWKNIYDEIIKKNI